MTPVTPHQARRMEQGNTSTGDKVTTNSARSARFTTPTSGAFRPRVDAAVTVGANQPLNHRDSMSNPFQERGAEAAIQQILGHIASPGSFFTGAERVSMVTHARAARGLETTAPPVQLPVIVAQTAARVAANAQSTRQSDVDAWIASGRDVLAYVEVVAVAAQISGIDSYHLALGGDLAPLPAPVIGSPTGASAPDAQIQNAWVPTVGVALAPTALSALPTESDSRKSLGKIWYLTDDIIHQYGAEPGRELSRPQMELVASRTSYLNECFF